MKIKTAIQIIAGAAFLSLFLIGCATNQSSPAGNTATSGRLVVNRIGNFGGITTVLLSVDGKQVATIVRGQTYNGWLTPGKHVISADIAPNYLNSPPSTFTINVQPGQTYSFTATWKADAMVLVQNK